MKAELCVWASVVRIEDLGDLHRATPSLKNCTKSEGEAG